MPFKSIKDKLSNVAGGEVLGDASAQQEEKAKKEKIKKPKKVKIPKQRKKKEKKPVKKKENILTKRKSSIFNKENAEEDKEVPVENEKVDDEEKEEDKTEDINKVRDAIEGYEDVLEILGIKEKIDVDADFSSEDLDYIEFTQTQPLGFDFEEVTDFISRTKYTMHKLESAIKKRDRDIVRVASEVKRVEQKMMEANQAKELERMTGGMTEEERLIEENMELKVNINDLTRKLKDGSANEETIGELKKQIELLQSENDMLKMDKSKEGSQRVPSGPSQLPSLDDDVEDAFKGKTFEGMLEDIGGLYNEQE